MPLKDYQPLTETVEAGKTSFVIRGLSFEDCTTLISKNMGDLEKATDLLDRMNSTHKDPQARSDALVQNLLKDVPGLVSSVVLLGVCEEEKSLELVQRLPMPVQIDAFVKVLNLTFEEVGGVKKFFETLIPMLQQMGLGTPVQAITQLLTAK